ncbi:histone-lysine N-methyltransferase setd8-a [Plakobranchus ocellatus]|uniref:Histone-lysine N-methyltransferase setd8-a n=1 Tax=Plakobranchus ocellatus TaxID=259542 RepID=A0AAV4AYP7_9GAST|nr:histone-lysine N-methyltransferase setd8-a [Plakobranchus ocellatus]
MAEMRLMANLIASFRKETVENALGIDLLNFRKFEVLNLIIKHLTEKEDGHEKAGLKGCEPARLTVYEWREAITGTWIDPNLIERINGPMEKYLIDNLKFAYQAEKGSHKLVPVLFPKDTLEPISNLLEERTNCNVAEDNILLFPNTGLSIDHASGYHCLKTVVYSCPNLQQPHLLIADKLRHRVSTLFAQLDLPAENREMFYRHMGHSEAINKNVYQCPQTVNEITRVGRFLLNTVDA